MAPEPLRSAMTTRSAEDTSLALPSDDKLRTGQRRVLDQVHTIKRSKSKPGKSESLSPSPKSKKEKTNTSITSVKRKTWHVSLVTCNLYRMLPTYDNKRQ